MGKSDLSQAPTEVRNYILSFVTDAEDLRNLSLSSKILFPESQRLLYHKSYLKGSTAITLWTRTILASPTHADLVFSVFLPTRANLSNPEKEGLAKCLTVLPRLEELYITHSMSIDSRDAYLEPRMIEGCSKRLRIFQNEIEDTDFNHALYAKSGFLETHPALETLYLAGPGQELTPETQLPKISETTLPRLTTLRIEYPALAAVFHGRSIRRLRIGQFKLTLRDVDALLDILTPFRDSLVSLNLYVNEIHPFRPTTDLLCSLGMFVKYLTVRTPSLEHLCILGNTTNHFASEEDCQMLLASLSAFPRLNSLILETAQQAYKHWGGFSYLDRVLYTKEMALDFARRFFAACKPLKMMSFMASNRHGGFKKTPYGYDPPAPCYARRRSTENGAVYRYYYHLDEESWARV